MKIKLSSMALVFSPIANPPMPNEAHIINSIKDKGGKKIEIHVELYLATIGIKKGPSKDIEASLTVSYQSDGLCLYASEEHGYKLLRFLKDHINPRCDADPWRWWQRLNWRRKVLVLEIRIPKPASSAK